MNRREFLGCSAASAASSFYAHNLSFVDLLIDDPVDVNKNLSFIQHFLPFLRSEDFLYESVSRAKRVPDSSVDAKTRSLLHLNPKLFNISLAPSSYGFLQLDVSRSRDGDSFSSRLDLSYAGLPNALFSDALSSALDDPVDYFRHNALFSIFVSYEQGLWSRKVREFSVSEYVSCDSYGNESGFFVSNELSFVGGLGYCRSFSCSSPVRDFSRSVDFLEGPLVSLVCSYANAHASDVDHMPYVKDKLLVSLVSMNGVEQKM